MTVDFEKSVFYDSQQLLSYNRILNFVIGARGIGKTYGIKKHVISRALKKDKMFIYLRRYKEEIKAKNRFFDKVKDEFPDVEFKVKNNEFYADEKLIGYALVLSQWQSLKGDEYPDVETIMYDEALREKDNSSYIPNEPMALLNFMDTVFRNRANVKCICLSNSVTVSNPYFLYFGIAPDINRRFNKYESIVVEIPEGKDFKDLRKQTRFGKLVANTSYAEMSIENKFIYDSDTFIKKRSKESKHMFNIKFDNEYYGIWADSRLSELYLSTEYDPSSLNTFVFKKEDMDNKTMMVTSINKNMYIEKFSRAFKFSLLRFDNQRVRTKGYEILKILNFK